MHGGERLLVSLQVLALPAAQVQVPLRLHDVHLAR